MRTLTPAKHRRFPASGFDIPRRRLTRAGFTLIELMTVLAIVGLLAMIAMPKLTNLKGRAQVVAMKSDLRNLVTLEENYFAQHLSYATAADLAGTYAVTAGNSMPIIALTGDGWTATLTSATAGQMCAVFMGSTPARPAMKEGAPACAEAGSSTVTQ